MMLLVMKNKNTEINDLEMVELADELSTQVGSEVRDLVQALGTAVIKKKPSQHFIAEVLKARQQLIDTGFLKEIT